VICTDIRGNTDLIEDNKGGYLFKPDVQDTAYKALKNIMDSSDRRSMGQYNLNKSKLFDIKTVLETMRKIYA
ncbi:MAG: hypothetical protein U0L45_01245, partial [Alistipes sp.]|nr:hypothetical protein [Alistipes sp.]